MLRVVFPIQAGKVLRFIAGVTPVIGGLASVAVATLESGDHNIQTQRVVKVYLYRLERMTTSRCHRSFHHPY